MAILEIKNVSKNIRGKQILKDISFSIDEGEIFGFVGPNGAGKSTLIKTMLGLYRKNSGQVIIDGEDVDKHFESCLRKIGAIIENPDMYNQLSGLKNLQIYANMTGNVSKEDMMNVVKLVKLENRIKDKVKTYSLGMKQRLGLAQALMHKPKLLILDEPTNGLDPIGIKELREILQKISAENKTSIFISSHILSEVENICSRIAIIDNGVIVDIKNIKEIKNENNNIIILEVSDSERAKRLIAGNFSKPVTSDDKTLSFPIEKQEIPKVLKLLSENGIDVYQVKNSIKTLEDEFMEKTTGSKDQIK
jgi:ABC-2 type transport system ATP-binding protein